MPGRYEMVEEPESLEVLDDEDVYHPDQTAASRPSVRVLEPVVAGPIGLKTVFYDPRWTGTQRRCCLGVLVIVSGCCLTMLIGMVVGLAKVLNHIQRVDELRKRGLYMIPDLHTKSPTVLIFSMPKDAAAFEFYQHNYVEEIDRLLKDYDSGQKSASFKTCAANERPSNERLCKVELKQLGTVCTAAENYGYNSTSPCILFAFRNVANWDEVCGDNVTAPLKLDCKAETVLRLRSFVAHLNGANHLQAGLGGGALAFRYFPAAGFDARFISPVEVDGERQRPPLVMVQLVNPSASTACALGRCTVNCTVDLAACQHADRLAVSRSVVFQFNNRMQPGGLISSR